MNLEKKKVLTRIEVYAWKADGVCPNMVFKTDKNFVTKVAFRAFTAPQLFRQFCALRKTVFTV